MSVESPNEKPTENTIDEIEFPSFDPNKVEWVYAKIFDEKGLIWEGRINADEAVNVNEVRLSIEST